VAINRRLSSSNPARYERDLPSSLNSLSLRLSAAGDASGALSAIEKAVAILRRLSASTPARYEPDLARSVSVLSDRLAGAGQIADALDAAREAWGLIQPYTERWPDGPHGRLGRAIQDHLHRLEERLAGDEPAGGAADSNPTTSG
jgi:hypothetical protein